MKFLLTVVVFLAAMVASRSQPGAAQNAASLKDMAPQLISVLNREWQDLTKHLTPEERARAGDIVFEVDTTDEKSIGYYSRNKTDTNKSHVLLGLGGIRLAFYMGLTYEITLKSGRDAWGPSYFIYLRRAYPRFLAGRGPLLSPIQASGLKPDPSTGIGLMGGTVSREIFRFLLAHELGHLVYRSPGAEPTDINAQSRMEETSADLFALELLKRSGTTPMGASMFLIAYMFVFERSLHAAPGTHPHALTRLKAVTTYVQAHIDEYPLTAHERGSVLQGCHHAEALMGMIAGNPHFWSDLDTMAAETRVTDLRLP